MIFLPERLEISSIDLKKSKKTLKKVIQINWVDSYCIKLRKPIKTSFLIESIIIHHFSDLSTNINDCIC